MKVVKKQKKKIHLVQILSLIGVIFSLTLIAIITASGSTKKITSSKAQEVSRCFHTEPNISSEQVNGGVNFNVSFHIIRDQGPEGHIYMFPPSCQTYLNVLRGNSFTYGPENTDSPIFVPNGTSKNVKYDVKIDECGELGNRVVTSCDLSVDQSGTPTNSCAQLPDLPLVYPVCKQVDPTVPPPEKAKPTTSVNQDYSKPITTTNNNKTTTTQTISSSITINPNSPTANTPFKVVITSATGYAWVHLKVFDQTGTKLIQEAGKKPGQPLVSKINIGFQWLYDLDGIKDQGTYKAIFYSDCNKGCKEITTQLFNVGVGNAKVTQTTKTVGVQQNTTTQNKNVVQQPNKITPKPTVVLTPTKTVPSVSKCKEIAYHGPNHLKLNLVFLPSGFPSTDDFLRDVSVAMESMDKTNLPNEVKNKINYYAYTDVSINLNSSLCREALICIDQYAARDYAQSCGGDSYVVIMNNPSQEQGVAYSICGQEAAITNKIVDGGIRPFPHELGHSIACLNDEYEVRGYTQDLGVNCSLDSSCPGWNKYSSIGCYPVCSSPSWFKSSEKSTMNHLQDFSWDFNPPSIEGWKIALKDYE